MNAALLDTLRVITKEEQSLLEGNELERALYTSVPRFLVDSARLMRRGEMISLRPHTRFADFPAHKHNYIEMMYMLSGTTRHRVNGGETLTLRAGELLMMNQHAEHAIEAASMDDIGVNIIVIPPFFDAVLDQIGRDNILGSFLMNALRVQDEGIACLHFRVAENEPVQLILESMIHNLVGRVPNGRRINQLSMSLLFLHLLNASDCLQFTPESRQAEGVAVSALREIEENYATTGLSQIAEKHGCSVSYLSRVVKQATGEAFGDLLRKKRIQKAAALLRQTSLTVAEIYAAVGYQNSSHFYRLFEQSYHMTPREYRKKSAQ